jgi:hypothetical protein
VQSGNPAISVLLILEHLAHEARSNQVKVTNNLFKRYGIGSKTKMRVLRSFADARTIKLEQSVKSAPEVTLLWLTKDGKLKGEK